MPAFLWLQSDVFNYIGQNSRRLFPWLQPVSKLYLEPIAPQAKDHPPPKLCAAMEPQEEADPRHVRWHHPSRGGLTQRFRSEPTGFPHALCPRGEQVSYLATWAFRSLIQWPSAHSTVVVSDAGH